MTKVNFLEDEAPEIKITGLCAPSNYEKEKPDLTLLDSGALKGAAYVMMDGSKRPGRTKDAWKDLTFEEAMNRVASGFRHLLDIKDGEFFDKDSGLQNADHLICNAMILRYHIEKYLKEKENGTVD